MIPNKLVVESFPLLFYDPAHTLGVATGLTLSIQPCRLTGGTLIHNTSFPKVKITSTLPFFQPFPPLVPVFTTSKIHHSGEYFKLTNLKYSKC